MEEAGRVEKTLLMDNAMFLLPVMAIKATGWANDDEKVQ